MARLLVFMTMFAACGSRSPLDADLLRLPPAESRDAGGSPSVDANADPPEPGCTRFIVTPPTILSNLYVDYRLSSAVTTSECVLVGFTTSNDPPRDRAWWVACVPFDAAGYAKSIFMDRPSVAATGPGLAFGFGHGGATLWDDHNGCRFATVDAKGTRTSEARVITSSLSCGIRATPKGFARLEDDRLARAISLESLDTNGASTGTVPLIMSNVDIGPVARPQAADGSFLLLWHRTESPCPCVPMLYILHFSAEGSILGDAHTIEIDPTFVTITATREGFLLAWGEEGTIKLMALDADGVPSQKTAIIENPQGWVVHDLGLTRLAGDQMMLVWARSRKGDIGKAPLIVARPVTSDGSAAGEELLVATPEYGGSSRVVSTPQGALVAFETGSPTQVAAAALLCGGR